MEYNEYDNFSPYKKLMEALKNSYDGLADGKNSVFQFLPAPMDADWATGISYELYQLMDRVPAERGIYYLPGTSSVSIAYMDVLDSLTEGNCRENDDYMRLKSSGNKCLGDLQSKQVSLKAKYMKEEGISEKQFRAKNLNAWIRECGLPEAEKYLKTLDKDYKKIEEKMEAIEEKLAAPYVRSKTDYSENLMAYEDANGQSITRPYCILSGNLQEKIEDWDGQKDDEFALKTTIKEDKRKKGDWKSIYDASFEASWFKRSVSAGCELSQLIADVSYTVELKLKGINVFQIDRGKWYHDNFVNPTMNFVQGSMFTKEQFFGENGTLQLIPTSVLVIYKPTIELTIDQEIYENRIRAALGKSPAASFFGLPLSLSAGIDRHRVNTPDDHVKLVFGPTASERPRVMGITSIKKYK